MIVTFLPNTNPTDYEGGAHKEDITMLTRPKDSIPVQFNICDFQCPYEEPKFAQGGTENLLDYKNDSTDLLFQLTLVTDTVTLKLFKCENGEEIEKATITDNTYGAYFDQSAFPDNLKIGFFADWNLIFNAFGPGRYFFTADRVIISVAQNQDRTWFYDLQQFDEIAADDTIRIDANQTGFIDGGIDYSGFNWISQIRYRGIFGKPIPKIEKDHYQTQGRSDRQVRDIVRTVYNMETELVPYEAIFSFLYDKFMSTNMFITTYELRGFLPLYQPINVVPEEIEDPTYFERNTNGKFNFTFIDKFHGPVKTNFL